MPFRSALEESRIDVHGVRELAIIYDRINRAIVEFQEFGAGDGIIINLNLPALYAPLAYTIGLPISNLHFESELSG